MQHNIARFIQQKHYILPVIDLDNAEDIIPITHALAAGGIHAIEITLRNQAAFSAIELARKEFPELCICAGTVTSEMQVQQLQQAQIDFIISPGISNTLLNASKKYRIDILPGISTASDILLGVEKGLKYFKFFPAKLSGGIDMLQALQGPFKDLSFFPTGGINKNNFISYLHLNNVFSIGGTWITTKEDIIQKNWQQITEKALIATDAIDNK